LRWRPSSCRKPALPQKTTGAPLLSSLAQAEILHVSLTDLWRAGQSSRAPSTKFSSAAGGTRQMCSTPVGIAYVRPCLLMSVSAFTAPLLARRMVSRYYHHTMEQIFTGAFRITNPTPNQYGGIALLVLVRQTPLIHAS
jgi:hypothetical protein